VIHAFYIPEFRIKMDILPGRYTYLYLRPEVKGNYTIYCTQYCGVGHSQMLAKLYVMEPREYEQWKAKEEEEASKSMPLADRGKALIEKNGCLACHSVDGSLKVGPSFKGLFGSTVELEGGTKVKADEDYIRESIIEPNAKVVKRYKPVMPTFKGIASDDDITAIIAYMKTIGAPGAAPAQPPPAAAAKAASAGAGLEIVEHNGCLGCHSVDGKPGIGPTFKGLYGSAMTLSDGKTVTADDAYIKESITDPNAKIVKGFQPMMPSFKDAIKGEELESVVEYIKSLK